MLFGSDDDLAGQITATSTAYAAPWTRTPDEILTKAHRKKTSNTRH